MNKDASPSDELLQKIAQYLENYIDLADNVPNDLIRQISQLHEKNFYFHKRLRKLESLLNYPVNGGGGVDNNSKNVVLSVHKCLAEIQALSDEKLVLAQTIYDTLETKQRSLEQDYRSVTPNTVNSTATPSKSGRESSRHFYTPKYKQGLSSAYNHSTNGHSDYSDEAETNGKHGNDKTGGSNNKIPKSGSNNSIADSNQDDDEDEDESPVQNDSVSPPPTKRPSRRVVHAAKPKEHHERKTRENHESKSPAKATKPIRTMKRHPKSKEIANGKRSKRERENSPASVYDANPVDPDEPTYCLCAQVSFGEMIGCDNAACPIEWFHFSCVKLTTKPKGRTWCLRVRSFNHFIELQANGTALAAVAIISEP